MYLQKENIVIRDAEQWDGDTLEKWWNDGRVMAHAGFPLGLGTSASEIRESLKNDSDETRRRLIIQYRKAPVGEMHFTNMTDGSARIGIKICEEDYQEKGLGKIVLSMLIRQLFNMGYEKIVLDTNLKNERAQHVYESLGFHKTAINRDSWQDQLGIPQSSIDYELVEKDFENFAEHAEEFRNSEQLLRITYFENLSDEIRDTLKSYKLLESRSEELAQYYESAQWRKDFEDDEKGMIPSDMKRGILSEDGIYDLLEEVRELKEEQ